VTPELLDLWLQVNTVFWIAWWIFAMHRFGWRRIWNGYVELVRGWAHAILGVSIISRLIVELVTRG